MRVSKPVVPVLATASAHGAYRSNHIARVYLEHIHLYAYTTPDTKHTIYTTVCYSLLWILALTSCETVAKMATVVVAR
jgi:hypothetical protein